MLKQEFVEKVILTALRGGGDFAELFYENSRQGSVMAADGKIRGITSAVTAGVGIRIFKGNLCVYASTNDLSESALLQTAAEAASVSADGKLPGQLKFSRHVPELVCKNAGKAFVAGKEDKIAFLHEITRQTFAESVKIVKVDGHVSEKERQILIANSDGLWAEDKQLYNFFNLHAIAGDGGCRFEGISGRAAQRGAGFYLQQDFSAEIADLVRISVEMLRAEDCPAGKMPVVIAPGNGAVLFHEAIGHSLEATQVAKNNSLFAGRQGQQIANEQITLVDDATLADAWGSFNMDDEGQSSRRNVLIENGVLKNYLVDRFNGRRMDAAANGCSRRENYTFAPTSRMSNTMVLPGGFSPEEIISSVKKGVYVVDFKGGSVYPSTSSFNFSAKRAYLIENGKISTPVKGVKLIGTSEEILQKAEMIGTDFKLSEKAGMCGSVSGRVPVLLGMPTVKVSEMTVGGQK